MFLNYMDENGYLDDDDIRTFELAARAVLTQELGPQAADDDIEIDLTMVTEDQIHEINRTYRNIDRPTDVLSFPQFNNKDEVKEVLEDLDDSEDSGDMYLILGDVVLCYDVAVKQAKEYGNSLSREMTYLFVHSMLHLLGYDHMEEDEKKVMREHEEQAMAVVGLTR